MFGDCGYQDQLKPYEELSQDHLKNLYWKMESIFTNETEFHLNREKAIEKYPELSSLQFNHIDITHKWMVIGGCFDDKAMLFFGGFILTEEDPSITLSYGDGPNRKDEILWKGTANTPNK